MSFYEPCSLRFMFFNRTEHYPLNERVQLVVSLARSVVFLHASRIVYKNISPENIIILHPGAGVLGTTLLVGLNGQICSMISGKGIYIATPHDGVFTKKIYNMGHDIYSIGVCFLEIGLWSSFANYFRPSNHE